MDEAISLLCIVCPMECEMKIFPLAEGNYEVSGNACPRGKDHALEEITSPARILTATLPIHKGTCKRIPVKSNNPVPREKLFTLMKEIKKLKLQAPIFVGDVIAHNILDTGADIVASKTILSDN